MNQPNEINCIYYGKEIQLLHDYKINVDIKWWDEEDLKNSKESYLKLKEQNKKMFEEYIQLFINGKKNKICF